MSRCQQQLLDVNVQQRCGHTPLRKGQHFGRAQKLASSAEASAGELFRYSTLPLLSSLYSSRKGPISRVWQQRPQCRRGHPRSSSRQLERLQHPCRCACARVCMQGAVLTMGRAPMRAQGLHGCPHARSLARTPNQNRMPQGHERSPTCPHAGPTCLHSSCGVLSVHTHASMHAPSSTCRHLPRV